MTWSHPDYPLLIPASIARSWEFSRPGDAAGPGCRRAVVYLRDHWNLSLFPFRVFVGERQGLLAGLVLLGTPFLILHGASQYADVPLSFFFVATVVLLFLHAQRPAQMGFLISGRHGGRLLSLDKE